MSELNDFERYLENELMTEPENRKSLNEASDKGWELIGFERAKSLTFEDKLNTYEQITITMNTVDLQNAVMLLDDRNLIYKREWIKGTFIEIEDFEHFCPLPGRISIDCMGEIVETDIGGMGLDDELPDGFYFQFQAEGDNDIYER